MKKRIIIAIAGLIFSLVSTAKETKSITVKDGFKHPESVVAHKQHLFISNTGEKLEPLAKDGDGFISIVSRKDGKIIQEKFISGLNSPKGMYIKRGVLYVADVDRIVGYNIDTKKKVYEKDFSKYGSLYLNDITKAVGGMYISSTLNDKIYKIKRNGKVKTIVLKNNDLKGVNGLYRRPLGRVFVANFGEDNNSNGNVGKFGVVMKKYKKMKSGGINDGIVKSRKVYYTDWVSKADNTGQLVVQTRREKKRVVLNTNIGGPSDIYADRKNRVLWIPAMNENKIVAVPFSLL